MSFAELGLAPTLLSALSDAGFTTPTSVQASAIPQALAGHDLMVSSQTGSGKTAAFMLPALHRIAQQPGNGGVGVQVLVLAPTRELALQVTEATENYGRNLPGLRTATVVGGMPYGAQLKALSRRVDVLVATPGRLLDHLQAGRVKLNTVHTLVLDEADRMLDMGFIEDIETIISRLPETRQTLLFSATLDGTVAKLAARMMRDPQRIEVAGHKEKHANITQSLLYADDAAHKMQLLDHVLRDVRLDQAIVFTSTKRGADDLADRLAEQGFAAAALHGDMNQRQRTRTLTQLQRGQVRVLVATDVAARGIDVQGISHAINFDLPMQAEDYVHRIGRTGRAGRDGLAFTLAVHSERHKIRRIESYTGQSLTAETIEGLEPKRTPRPSSGGGGGYARHGKPNGGGKRPGGFGGQRREGGWAPREGAPRSFDGDRPQRSFDGERREGGFAPRGDGFKREGGFGERKSFGDRREGGFAPRGDGFKREGGFGERKSFGDRREGGFAPRADGFKREGGFGERKSFGDRREGGFAPRADGFKREGGFGERKSFGDRREGGFAPRADGFKREGGFGERKSFGDRREGGFAPRGDGFKREGGFAPRGDGFKREGGFGERKSFGDRPQRPGFEGRPAKSFDKRPAPGGKRFAGSRD
ncbi:ATP-dependent RNA helicase [Bordetella ansorpii]|uniref:DEAD-box ATP-dependent RNA helicase RhpA n=1 Tax=Bordetella ansorpii TaxID=288768 RepID=A0A157SAL0_9BORD|nr:DEAD/DEAH box helicase [Bordetella ansorpii]SAI67283.1 ATP-dependent RNA helicase [Bordetella ansorpii]